MSKVEQIMELVKEMTVLELSELVKALEEEFGVTAAAPVAAVAAPAAAEAAEEEEKDEYDVILTGPGEEVQVIKVVREITGLGLKGQGLVDEASRLEELARKAEAIKPAEGRELVG